VYDEASRRKARTVAEARGIAAAATVTGVGETTLRRWAAAEGWSVGRHQAPSAVTAGFTPERADEKSQGAQSAVPRPMRDPARELAEDAELARRVFRQQGEAVLDGHGKPTWFRDAAVAWGISQDKVHQYGAPAGGWQRGREFTWAAYFAEQDQRMARLEYLVELAEGREVGGDG
jgi:hypothetical protein